MNKYYKMLLSASLLANFGDNLIGPFYAVFVEKIGGSILDMGYTVTVFSVCTGFLMIIIGRISDKLNKELITIFGYTMYALGSLLYVFISSPWQLFGLQIVFAVSAVVFIGTFIVDRFGFNVLFISMFCVQVIAVLIQIKLYFTTKTIHSI